MVEHPVCIREIGVRFSAGPLIIMNKKIIVAIIAVAAGCLSAGYFVGRGKQPALVPTPTVSPIGVDNNNQYEESANITIRTSAPVLDNQAFNAVIDAFVDEQMREAKAIADESGRHENLRHTLDIIWNELYMTPRLASFYFTVSSYTGGAHGNHAIVGMNFDLANDKSLELIDLFRSNSGYGQKLSEIATAALREKLGDDLFAEGVDSNPENFSSFTIDEEGITFHFSPYQVAAYAYGHQQVKVEWGEVKDYLTPLGLEIAGF